MSGRRKHCASPSRTGSAENESQAMPRLSQNKAKTSKLSKSLRQTQQSPSSESTYNYQNDLKTPKRYTRIGLNSLNNADSPNNDSELQQDIIWDANSPTPVRKGKGATKLSRNVVDISEIVSRIAPVTERPSVSELNLLQWIGDSAVPCTPDVRQHKTRRKSTRQNGVEDLMKLAKQFDINMIQQEKEQEKELQAGEPGIDGPGAPHSCGTGPTISLSKLGGVSEGATFRNTTDAEQPCPELAARRAEDSLDALFDGPTQPASGRLSQDLSVQSQEIKWDPVGLSPHSTSVRKGVHSAASNPPLTFSENTNKIPSASQDFDDDWDDVLFDDSFVLEMTLNPAPPIAPKYCSTQNDLSEKKGDPIHSNGPSATVGAAARGQLNPGVDGGGSAGICPGKNEKSKNRSTFKLETNPHFQPNGGFSGTFLNGHRVPEEKAQSHFCPSSGPVSMVPGHQGDKMTQHPPNKLQNVTSRPFVGETSVALSVSHPAPSIQTGEQTSGGKDQSGAAADTGQRCGTETSEEDLDSFFMSDSLWDDGDDDDLLCQLCNDVEKSSQSQGQSMAKMGTSILLGTEQKKAGSNLFPAAPGGSEHSHVTHVRGLPPRPPSTFTRSCSFPRSNASILVNPTLISHSSQPQGKVVALEAASHSTSTAGRLGNRNGPYKFTQVRGTLSAGSNPGPVGGPRDSEKMTRLVSVGSAPAPLCQTSFKRHLSDPVALTSKVFVSSQVAARCSEEEIERKKQQALARRRLRQATQQLGAPS